MIPFLALVRKDLKLFFNDRRAVIVSILVPIVLASFFGYLFGGQGGNAETSKVPVMVIDQDGSDISRGLITQLGSDKNLDVKPSTLEAGREAVRKGKATAAIVIPQDFGRDAGHALFTGATKPELGVLYDPSHNVELGMVKGILSGAVMQAVSKEMFTGKSGRDMVNESLAQVENSSQMPAENRKALRDLLGGVKEFNEQQDREGASGQGELSGGLSMPYQTREQFWRDYIESPRAVPPYSFAVARSEYGAPPRCCGLCCQLLLPLPRLPPLTFCRLLLLTKLLLLLMVTLLLPPHPEL